MRPVQKPLDFTIADETPIRLVHLVDRWIFVGPYILSGLNVCMPFGYCARWWGTTEGLGELAEKGQASEQTALDPFFREKNFVLPAELFNDAVNEEVWLKLLAEAAMQKRLKHLGRSR